MLLALQQNNLLSSPSSEPHFVAASALTLANGVTSGALNKPAGTLQGHVMIVACAADDAAGTFTTSLTSAGFTQLGADSSISSPDGVRMAVWYKVAGASEPASWTVTRSGGAAFSQSMAIVTYKDLDTAALIDASIQFTQQSTGQASPVTVNGSAITTNSANALTFFIAVSDNVTTGGATWSPPSGFTQRVEADEGTFTSVIISDRKQASQGSSGALTGQLSFSSGNAGYISATLAFKTIGVGGGSSGIASAQEINQDVGSSIGVVLSSGQVALVESGADVCASIGIVPVFGQGLILEQASDLAVCVGSSSSVGVAAAAETGSDACLLIGTAQSGSTGVALSQEQIADLAAANGFVSAQGLAQAIEQTQDAALLQGSVAAQGFLTAVESGFDTASAVGTVQNVASGVIASIEQSADAAQLQGVSAANGLAGLSENGQDLSLAIGVTAVLGFAFTQESTTDLAAAFGSSAPGVNGVAALIESGSDVCVSETFLQPQQIPLPFAESPPRMRRRGRPIRWPEVQTPQTIAASILASVSLKEGSADSAIADGFSFVQGFILTQEGGAESIDIAGTYSWKIEYLQAEDERIMECC